MLLSVESHRPLLRVYHTMILVKMLLLLRLRDPYISIQRVTDPRFFGNIARTTVQILPCLTVEILE